MCPFFFQMWTTVSKSGKMRSAPASIGWWPTPRKWTSAAGRPTTPARRTRPTSREASSSSRSSTTGCRRCRWSSRAATTGRSRQRTGAATAPSRPSRPRTTSKHPRATTRSSARPEVGVLFQEKTCLSTISRSDTSPRRAISSSRLTTRRRRTASVPDPERSDRTISGVRRRPATAAEARPRRGTWWGTWRTTGRPTLPRRRRRCWTAQPCRRNNKTRLIQLLTTPNVFKWMSALHKSLNFFQIFVLKRLTVKKNQYHC